MKPLQRPCGRVAGGCTVVPRPAAVRPAKAPTPVFDIVGRPTPHGVTWAWVQEDLDLATVPTAEKELDAFLTDAETPGFLLVYVGAERFVDLRGLRLLVRVATQLRSRGGELGVVAPPQSLRLLVEVVGPRDQLRLLSTARHARRWARSSRGTVVR